LLFSFSLACAARARDACRCHTWGRYKTYVGANAKSAVKNLRPTAYLLRPGSEYLLRFSGRVEEFSNPFFDSVPTSLRVEMWKIAGGECGLSLTMPDMIDQP
jgi:hypothetical protein